MTDKKDQIFLKRKSDYYKKNWECSITK